MLQSKAAVLLHLQTVVSTQTVFQWFQLYKEINFSAQAYHAYTNRLTF